MTVKLDDGGMHKAIIMCAFRIRLCKITRSAEVTRIQLTARIISDEEHGPEIVGRPAPTLVHNEPAPLPIYSAKASKNIAPTVVLAHQTHKGSSYGKPKPKENFAGNNAKEPHAREETICFVAASGVVARRGH